MARDRKRARQRRSRPIREGASAPSQNRPVRADVPAALSHAGDVDEFDAALIAGAGGVPVEQPVEVERNGEGSLETSSADLVPASTGGGGRRNGRGDESVLDELPEPAPPDGATPATKPSQPLPRRAIAFLRASWAELQRVQWPDRRQVTQATAVVLGFVAVAGLYLGAADWAAQKIVNFIL
ncbi:MAG TPA: preprotein translocase subunit SecE [Solirubrobacteraceae bacterium]